MSSGASVCPMKMLPAADNVSAPDVRIVRIITQATPFTTHCMTPRWYSRVMSEEKKMMVGSTEKAKYAPVFATVEGAATMGELPGSPGARSLVVTLREGETKKLDLEFQ